MKARLIFALLIAVLFQAASPILAEKATPDEALNIAKNWVTVILAKKGAWGDSPTAQVMSVQEFKRGGRLLGYFCPVSPRGYIIVSLRKPLEPVKAYSETSNINPASDNGMADVIKLGMERVLSAVESRVGTPEKARTEDIERILDVNYLRSWEKLAVDPATFRSELESRIVTADYAESDVLLTTSWHQEEPYNDQCPPGDGCDHCVVGCVATAAAQIMRYWHWPPYGIGNPYDDPYDWVNMPDTVTGASPQAEIDAVAELCHEIGEAVGMDYDCDTSGSGAFTWQMEDVYQFQYWYSLDCRRQNRADYTAVDWFEMIKGQLNANRPLQYRVGRHSVVCDGWEEVGGTPDRYYHMNYGWDDSYTTWYLLDALYLGDQPNLYPEYVLEDIFPAVAVDTSFSGTFSKETFPYRYFTRDSVCGTSATFEAGQYIQFLPNITVTGTSTGGGSIRFEGVSANHTTLFTRGDTSAGAHIRDGTIKISEDGQIVLR